MNAIPFDICVLSAANEQQAQGYEKQLEWRQQYIALAHTDLKVFADPDGKRIGSGGSSFYVLDELFRIYGDSLFSKRVLILHSGGDSRRLPAYSAVGKIFMPLPTEKHRTLFDVMIENYSYLPAPAKGQVIITSGDVLLNFDPAFAQFSPIGITGVAYAENPEQGEHFGVYVVKDPQQGLVTADDVLQKPDKHALLATGAIDAANRIWIDTGILHLAPDALAAWLNCKNLINAARDGAINYNLYHEILYAIQGKADVEDAKLLRTQKIHVNCLPYCGFYHVGKSTDVLQNFYTLTHASARYQFKNSIRSNAARIPALKSAWVYNSVFTAEQLTVQKPCVIEGCFIQHELKLDGHNILTNVPQQSADIHLDEGVCLTVLPVESDKWVAVIYGIKDQFKGSNPTFLNKPVSTYLKERHIQREELWPSRSTSNLWDARLFPCTNTPAEAIKIVSSLQDGEDFSTWRQSNRLSMSEILHSVNQVRLLENHRCIEKKSLLLTLRDQLTRDDFSFAELQHLLETPEDTEHAIEKLQEYLATGRGSYQDKARIHFWLAQLLQMQHDENKSKENIDAAFLLIRKGVAAGLETASSSAFKIFDIRSDQVVWALLPARLDFAGGWTDTPPICLDRGGAVLNASVTLNGQYPIQVIGKIRPHDYSIGINSIDLGQRSTIYDFAELNDYKNPADWLSLPKAAFFAAGIFDQHEQTLEATLRKMGGGIDLTLFSALPAGSGLGTSSILGAGLIATLSRMTGGEVPRQELYARTSNLEQLMTTGGGWQDQIGGVAGGVKLVTTAPGYDQKPLLAWTHLKQPNTEIDDHFLLYYTGIRRMAKNLLRQVVGRYLNRDAEAVTVLQQLALLAKEMKDDLDHRRIDAFGAKIRTAWRLNKSLDAGQTTADIEKVLARIDDLMLGAKLLGAGGGGFLFIAAKDKNAALRIRKELAEHPPNDRARFFDFDIDHAGMRVTVL